MDKVKYMWRVEVKVSGKDAPVVLHGIAANVNVAISKAKKKVSDMTDTDELVVTCADMLHQVEF